MFRKVLYSNTLFFSADNVVMQQVALNVSNLVCNGLLEHRNPTPMVDGVMLQRC